MPRELGRYTGNTIAEQIGVVRLQDDATAATRALIQGTGALAEKASETAALATRQYADTFQIDQRAAFTELTKKHELDPEAFKAAWKGHTDGTMKNVPWAFRNEASRILGDLGSRGYAHSIETQNAAQKKNAADVYQVERQNKENDYLATAAAVAAGTATREEAEKKRVAYSLHLEDGVRLGLIDEKGAALLRNELVTKAHAEAFGADTEKMVRAETSRPTPMIEGPARTAAGTHFGYANNNPGNMMVPGKNVAKFAQVYPGAIGVDERGFAKFSSPEAGLAAMARVIRGYGETTLLGILSRYAPKGHGNNDPEAYAETVGKALGVSPVARIDVGDPEFMARLLPAMIKVETGQAPKYSPEMYANASSPIARAKEIARQRLEEFRTNPDFAPLRTPTTLASIEARVRRTIAEAEADAELARRRNNEDFTIYTQRLARGLDIDVAEASRRQQESLRLGDHIGAQKWGMVATKGAALAEFGRMTFADQDADLQATRARAQANPRDEASLFEYEIKQQVAERARSEFRRDSFGYLKNAHGRDLGAVPEIDFTRPDVAALRQISGMADVLEARGRIKSDPLPAEAITRFASSWKVASSDDKSRIAAAIYDGLGPARASDLFAKLDKNGNVNRATIFAAAIAPVDGPLAREIFDGLGVMEKSGKPALSNEQDFNREFNNLAGRAFVSGLNHDKAAAARDANLEAARALIAREQAAKGKLGEVAETTLMQDQIKRVLASVVRHNGKEIFPLRRDQTQAEFDALFDTVRDHDAPKLKAGDGSEMTITQAIKRAELENVGDGRYVFRYGANFYLTQVGSTKAFVLDRAFFNRMSARIAGEDMGAFIAGEPKPDRRVRTSKGQPLGVPVEPKGPFENPKGGITGQE